MIEAVSIIFTLAVIFGVINYKFIKLPFSIGVFLMGILFALIIWASTSVFPEFHSFFAKLINDVDFKSVLLDGLLGFLLFAGAMHVNLKELDCSKWAVLLFSTVGVLITAAISGLAVFGIAILLGVDLPFIYALLFGALIAPTDPVAVLSILGNSSLSESIKVKFEGESLFNDGVGVILFSGIFLVIHSMTSNTTEIASEIGFLLLEEIGGGISFGLTLGFIGYKVMLWVKENEQLATMVSLAVVVGGYVISLLLHISGPLAMVVAGLLIGQKIHLDDACDPIQKSVADFWKHIDNVLNAIVFFSIGLLLHLIDFEMNAIILGLSAIVVVLIARFISIYIPFSLLEDKSEKRNKAIKILTWGGLRGGVSIALAIGISDMDYGKTILLITFCVVCFSIVVQGLTVGKVYKKLFK